MTASAWLILVTLETQGDSDVFGNEDEYDDSADDNEFNSGDDNYTEPENRTPGNTDDPDGLNL